jgi:hypothetical protein
MLLSAERVIVIDRYPERLSQVHDQVGAETLDYRSQDILPELKEMTGGRGPDVCIEAVGMEAHGTGPGYLYDQVKQQLRLQTDRPTAVREAIMACRKGGSVYVLGVFGAVVDKFPLGALMNKGLTLRAAQQHGQRYIPMLLERMAAGELRTEHLATHVLSLEDGRSVIRCSRRRPTVVYGRCSSREAAAGDSAALGGPELSPAPGRSLTGGKPVTDTNGSEDPDEATVRRRRGEADVAVGGRPRTGRGPGRGNRHVGRGEA